MNQNSRPFLEKLARRPLAWFLLGAAVVLYLRLFIPPFTPIMLGGDQSVFLTNAGRMLYGQVIYRDFFQFTPPGTTLIYFAFFKVFGQRAWIPNVVILLLGVGLTWLTVLIARKIVGRAAALLSGLLFLTFVYVYILDATHHRFSVLAVAAAVALVIETRTVARVFAAGALCGLASFFTQSRGVVTLLALIVFLLWEKREKRQSWDCLLKLGAVSCMAFAGTVAAANAYFIWKAGLARVAYCQVTFFLKYLPVYGYYMVDLPPVPPWHNLPKLGIFLFVHALVPLVYILLFVRCYRKAKTQPREHWDRLILVSIVGLFLFVEIAPAAMWIRLFGVALPAFITFVWFVSNSGRLGRAVAPSLWVIALTLAVAEPWWTQRHSRAALDLPVGRATFLDQNSYEKLKWIRDRTRPSDFFFEAGWPGFYFPLGLRNPAYMDMVSANDSTRPEQVGNVIACLEEQQVRFVLWSMWLDAPGDSRMAGDHLGPLRAYLRTHYHVVKVFDSNDEALERNP
jgi:hypothetical protein